MVKIRPLGPTDAKQIQAIAQSFPGFTIPSEYVLWMLSQTQREFCLVLEDGDNAIKGYLLTLSTANPEEVFVWQFAATAGMGNISSYNLRLLMNAMINNYRARGIKYILFTIENEDSLNLIYRLVKKSVLGPPEVYSDVILPIPNGEKMYQVRI